ncbi:hypothetical protein ACOMHN_048414 [Nucella lapillus]
MANTCLKATQIELQEERIGRDQYPQYSRFSTPEAAAVRYIRMACEVLGPRGDQKSGCRDAWIAYCSMTGRQSVISSFKANRFNNLFQAAAALHFHRPDIIRFFVEFIPERNSKLTSVLFDAESEKVSVYVLSLALVYLRVTGPYWQLLGCKTHYLDFYMYVVEMRTQLEEWKNDADTIFEALPGLFGKPVPNDDLLQAALLVSMEMKNKTSLIFQKLAESFIKVIEAQLTDFLPNGSYYNVNDGALRQKLAHSVITNMVGEACFGDLDLSIYKRRNSSCHHHTTVTMMMRNKMMEKWFSMKPAVDQTQLLHLSAKKAGALRQKHRQEERDAIARRRLELEGNQQRREQQKAALARKKDTIIRTLLQHSGPCKTPGDVSKLMRRLKIKRRQKEALTVEMNYHKVVLGVRSPLLRTTQPVPPGLHHAVADNALPDAGINEQLQPLPDVPPPEAAHNAQAIIADNALPDAGINEQLQPLPDVPPPEAAHNAQAIIADADNGLLNHAEDGHMSDSSSEGAQHQPGPDTLSAQSFDALKIGDMVAVYYDDDYHIGSIHELKNSNTATINFMKKCVLSNNTYVWPQPRLYDDISWCYIFEADFQIDTRNGRIWNVPIDTNLDLKYQMYKKKVLCINTWTVGGPTNPLDVQCLLVFMLG